MNSSVHNELDAQYHGVCYNTRVIPTHNSICKAHANPVNTVCPFKIPNRGDMNEQVNYSLDTLDTSTTAIAKRERVRRNRHALKRRRQIGTHSEVGKIYDVETKSPRQICFVSSRYTYIYIVSHNKK